MVTMQLAVSPVGQRVKDSREQRGISQEDLARMAGVKRSWLGLLETGRIQRPGADMIGRVADALDMDVHYLLTGERRAREPQKAAAVRRLERLPLDILNRLLETAGVWVSDLPAGFEAPSKRLPQRHAEGGATEEHGGNPPTPDSKHSA